MTGGFKDRYHTGGVLAGAIWQQNGFLSELGRQFPALTYITDYYSNLGHGGYNGWSSPWPVAPRRWGGSSHIISQTRDYTHDAYSGDQYRDGQGRDSGRTRVILPGGYMMLT